jgi:hypothetical protein
MVLHGSLRKSQALQPRVQTPASGDCGAARHRRCCCEAPVLSDPGGPKSVTIRTRPRTPSSGTLKGVRSAPCSLRGPLCSAWDGRLRGAVSPTPARAARGRCAGRNLGSGLELETNSRQLTPKHDGKPAIIRDQRTRPVNKIDNPAESAKPPSPVQIRAAPPFFRGPFRSRG